MIQDPVGGVVCLPGKKGGHDPGTDNPDCGERVVGACRKVLSFLSPHTKVHVSPVQAKTTCLLSWSWGGWISFPFLSFFFCLIFCILVGRRTWWIYFPAPSVLLGAGFTESLPALAISMPHLCFQHTLESSVHDETSLGCRWPQGQAHQEAHLLKF